MSKRIFFIVLCLWLAAVAFPLFAQGKSDTVYTFRFVTDRDMFYVPFNGNDAELSRLLECVEQYKPDILNKRVPLHVDGYCTAGESDADNLAMAKVRSNRVKSELIVRGGIKEECFVTKNHSGGGDYVTVRIVIPAVMDDAEEACLAAGHRRTEESEQQRLEQERAAREKAERERAEAARLASEQAMADSLARERAAAGSETETVSPSAEKAEDADSYTLSLRANLLRWATLTPDVGHHPKCGHSRERLVDFMELERQGPPLCPLGSDPGSALLYGREESLVSGCDVQDRTVQLQALRNRQAGRPDGWRHHCRLPAAAEQGIRS